MQTLCFVIVSLSANDCKFSVKCADDGIAFRMHEKWYDGFRSVRRGIHGKLAFIRCEWEWLRVLCWPSIWKHFCFNRQLRWLVWFVRDRFNHSFVWSDISLDWRSKWFWFFLLQISRHILTYSFMNNTKKENTNKFQTNSLETLWHPHRLASGVESECRNRDSLSS